MGVCLRLSIAPFKLRLVRPRTLLAPFGNRPYLWTNQRKTKRYEQWPQRDSLAKEGSMKVINVNGTSDNTCTCYSWLEHWKKFNTLRRSVPPCCHVVRCVRTPTVGVHVQKEGGDMSWFIVLLCAEHNGKTGQSLELSDLTSLASANVNETCGKSK